jgi:predicted nucleic acid-binding protein
MLPVSSGFARIKDLPMDYADATIVCLASATGISNIFTLDLRDFSVYRMEGNKGFTLFPLG